MDGVAIDLAGGGLEQPRPLLVREGQQMAHANYGDHDGIMRIGSVVDRRRRARQVVYLVDWPIQIERLRHVVLAKLKPTMRKVSLDILPAAGKEVVQADDKTPLGEKTIAKVRSPRILRHRPPTLASSRNPCTNSSEAAAESCRGFKAKIHA